MKRIITEQSIRNFQQCLYEEEKSSTTIQKYIRDVKKLMAFAGKEELTKKRMIEYKEALMGCKQYKTSSINSYLVAINRFLSYMGWHDLCVKTCKVQKETFTPENRDLSREEYKRLVETAMADGRTRLALVIQTICATGIRVSELGMITVDAVRNGMADVSCKGKERRVLIPRSLQMLLLEYIRREGMDSGPVFCTSSGRPMDRSNIWKEMKMLCEEAGVEKEKVYPHNLRHLFAKTYYQLGKDIGKTADILGHSSIETTRIYIKTPSQKHRKILEDMGLVLTI